MSPAVYQVQSMTASQERNWAMWCHLASFLGFVVPFGHIIAPLVLWQMKKDVSPLIDQQGKESVNYELSITLYLFVAFLASFLLIGIPVLFGLVIFDLVIVVMAAVQTGNGTNYRYPMTIRFVK